jgi:hypothetical protein
MTENETKQEQNTVTPAGWQAFPMPYRRRAGLLWRVAMINMLSLIAGA